MTEENIVIAEKHQGYRAIILNRPGSLNAFSRDLHEKLMSVLHEAEQDADCRAVLLTGAGRAFCAGQDLTERVFADNVAPDLSENLVERYNPLISFIRSTRLPIVAAVNGVAAGAGASLAFACDIVIASRSAKFIQSFSRIGLIPDAGGTWTVPRLAGEARARAMMMLGEPVPAEQAAEWGMIWRVVEDDMLQAEAASMCRKLAEVPGDSIALIKQALGASAVNSLQDQLALEAGLQKQAGVHPDYRRSVEKFRSGKSAKG